MLLAVDVAAAAAAAAAGVDDGDGGVKKRYKCVNILTNDEYVSEIHVNTFPHSAHLLRCNLSRL